MKQRILIASAVRQPPAILNAFLDSLEHLDRSGCETDFLFLDQSADPVCARLLHSLAVPGCDLQVIRMINNGRSGDHRDFFLRAALEKGYSHLLLLDSDLNLHPQTLRQLLAAGRDIVSEIAWLAPGQRIAPGVLEMGRLTGCSLISAKAIRQGAGFGPIQNAEALSAGQRFCLRAEILGVKLYVDTSVPACRLAQPPNGMEDRDIKPLYRKSFGNRLTLSMAVHPADAKGLRAALTHARQYIDHAVIVNYASIRQTETDCHAALSGITWTLSDHTGILQTPFIRRRLQWAETIQTEPDWILGLDAGELLDDEAVHGIRGCIDQNRYDVIYLPSGSPVSHLGAGASFHDSQRQRYRPYFVRYLPGFPYSWRENTARCSRLPENIVQLPGSLSPFGVKRIP